MPKMAEVVTQITYLCFEKALAVCKAIAAIVEYAIIVHDSDKDSEGNPIPAHLHILIKLRNSCTYNNIAKWFGLEPQYVNRIKARRFEQALLYLTHKNAPEKFQYDDSAVISNFDWIAARNKYLKSVEPKKSCKERWDEISELIENGTIRPFNLTEYITNEEYHEYKKKIQDAFDYATKTERLNQMNEDRNLEAIYIQGDSGVGKTTWAKEYALEKYGNYYISDGGKNPLDNYNGEDVLILDDLRPSTMGMSDLLKLLDNNTASMVPARFYNKFLTCKLIIITTVLDIDTFFKNVFNSEKEPLIQLKRRCQKLIVFKENSINVFMYDSSKENYVKIGEYENTVLKKYPNNPLTEDDKRAALEDLGFASSSLISDLSEYGSEWEAATDDDELLF